MRGAGAVLHSHAQEVAMITLLYPGREFRVSRLEMIKGIAGHGYEDTLVVPIVENTPHEEELTEVMREAIEAYPRATAVLVRRHGIYVWGETWQKAKSQSECYHYLFKFVLDAHLHGIHLAPIYPTPKVILLDIEGTTSSITFVKDTLFPLARKGLKDFLSRNRDVEHVKSLMANEKFGPNASVEVVVSKCLQWMDEDQKEGVLKELQGLVWADSYERGEVVGHLYEDTAPCMREWKSRGIDLAIYSSGSIFAQKLLFRHSVEGDLGPIISNYFDTTSGHKREVQSYHNIAKALGIPSTEIFFLSDIKEELDAAVQAGMQVSQVCRDGIPQYLYNYPHPLVTNFKELRF